MAAAAEKTAEEIRRELQELQRQHREISERLRDPRGLRRGAPAAGPGPGPGGLRPLRGFARPAPEPADQPEPKRRLLSAVVKVDGSGTKEDDANDAVADGRGDGPTAAQGGERRGASNGGFRRDGSQWVSRRELDNQLPEPLPRPFPKEEDQSLVRRNKRMLGKLLVGTLEKFQQENKKLSNSEAFLRRSEAQQKADQKAREDSERLRQQEREQAAEKRRRDMTLRARVAAKAEEKRLELLYIQWSEHHKKLSSFLRTKAEPAIYYMPAKPIVDDPVIVEQNKEKVFEEWKSVRRTELTQFQKQVEDLGRRFTVELARHIVRRGGGWCCASRRSTPSWSAPVGARHCHRLRPGNSNTLQGLALLFPEERAVAVLTGGGQAERREEAKRNAPGRARRCHWLRPGFVRAPLLASPLPAAGAAASYANPTRPSRFHL